MKVEKKDNVSTIFLSKQINLNLRIIWLFLKYLDIYLGKILRVKCSIRGLLFIACAIWMFVRQTPKSWFVFPLVSKSMKMTSRFLFPPMVSLSLRLRDFSTRPSEGERLYHEGFRGSRVFVHVPIPVFPYPEIQSAVPGDHQRL